MERKLALYNTVIRSETRYIVYKINGTGIQPGDRDLLLKALAFGTRHNQSNKSINQDEKRKKETQRFRKSYEAIIIHLGERCSSEVLIN